jgi:hypothetical protein
VISDDAPPCRAHRPRRSTASGGCCVRSKTCPGSTSEPSAGRCRGEAAQAVSKAVVFAIDWCEQDGYELNEKQKIMLVYGAFQTNANLEASFARALIDESERAGIEDGGLSSELARDPLAGGGVTAR